MRKVFLILLALSFLAIPAFADAVTFASPAGGEVWARGSQHTITYTLAADAPQYEVVLKRNGVFVGYIYATSWGAAAGVINHPWEVGKVQNEDEEFIWAPIGSGYTICTGCWGSGPPPYGVSNSFSIEFDFSLLAGIKRIVYAPLPKNVGCPQCISLDLTALREALIRLHEPVAAGLYLKGMIVASLGQVGGRPEMAVRLQLKLGPEAQAALNRGEEFELRVLNGRMRSIHSQAVRLVTAGRVAPGMEPVLKR